jgi:hypothetical protein
MSETSGECPCKSKENLTVDPKGARALAARIASGPPDERDEETPRAHDPTALSAEEKDPQKGPAEGHSPTGVEIVQVKPDSAPRREVRIYVRGPNGDLERHS